MDGFRYINPDYTVVITAANFSIVGGSAGGTKINGIALNNVSVTSANSSYGAL